MPEPLLHQVERNADRDRPHPNSYHHVIAQYLVRYAQENAWREDHRRGPTGIQVTCCYPDSGRSGAGTNGGRGKPLEGARSRSAPLHQQQGISHCHVGEMIWREDTRRVQGGLYGMACQITAARPLLS